MRNFFVLIGTVLALAIPASAQPVLIELFSSHNCPASQEAHGTLKQVAAERDDVLVLTWSVDYWDYLGEPDPMAIQMSTIRQEAYIDRFGLRGPYTPQTVYNGAQECQGNKPEDIAHWLGELGGVSHPGVAIRQTVHGWTVDVPAGLDADVHVVSFLSAGDNTTGMVNPVTGMDTLAHLKHGGAVGLSQSCASACALLVQASGHGVIYSAQQIQ